jgi:hypothetical protein
MKTLDRIAGASDAYTRACWATLAIAILAALAACVSR